MAWKNHTVCTECWNKREPDRIAVRLRDDKAQKCCVCGMQHASGIYIRAEIDNCKGEHNAV